MTSWSSDGEDAERVTSKPPTSIVSLHPPSLRQLQNRLEAAALAEPVPQAFAPLPSLQGICLGVVGDYLGDFLELAGNLLPLLPSQYKNCLLGIARRKGLLDDRALELLAEEGQGCLDCHATRVTEPAIRAALAAMLHLRQVDLTGCPAGPATLRLLGECCPLVEVLRIGGSPVRDETCAGALRRLLPQLEKAQHADVDSWEALDPGEEGAELAGPSGRLMRLRCLTWPGMPFELQRHCKEQCPLVAVNLTAEDVSRRGLPAEFDPGTPLDAGLFTGLVDPSRWEQPLGGTSAAPELHIAEKFRRAYVEQAQRMREKAERAERRWQQRRRREILRSPAEVAIRRWLDDSLDVG